MEQVWKVLLVSGLLYLPHSALTADWSYAGEKGAHKWPQQFKKCAGRNQSPINVDTADTQFDPSLTGLTIHVPQDDQGRMILIHNEHTIQVNTIGWYYIYGGGLPSNYRTAQFHLHWGKNNHRGSEHQIDGQSYPLELHIVAYDYMNYSAIDEAKANPMGLAVLGTLFIISDEDNPVLEPIIRAAQHVKDPDVKDTQDIETIRLTELLPRSTNRYYRYNGSLTTPGCWESVLWTVFEEKQTVSKRQLRMLRAILKPSHSHAHQGHKPHDRHNVADNFRPIQPLNGRTVYRSFPRKGEVPTQAMKTKHAVWSYKGDKGPDKWKAIYPDAGCDGKHQSPINIAEHNTMFDEKLADFDIQTPPPDLNPTMTVLNNGHTIKVQLDENSGDYLVTGGGLPTNNHYKVLQLHFHWGGEDNKGSEHHVNGHAYPIELHIVTWDAGNYASVLEAIKEPKGLAVLGVLFEVVHDDNPALQPLMDVMEQVADPERDSQIEIPALDLEALLPADTSRYFRYDGSLTTPGCHESVIWTVFRMTQTLSHKQLRQFREILKHQDDTGDKHKVLDGVESAPHGGGGTENLGTGSQVLRERLVDNFRPLQPLNDRVVYRSYKIITGKRKKSGSNKHSWSYSGHTGPKHWHNIEARCDGRQQSPINILTSQTDFNPRLKDFNFYDPQEIDTKMSIVNNGHTVKVKMLEGEHYVYGGGLASTYQTLQLHFHWGGSDTQGSEHTLNGQAFPLELHVVNYDSGKYDSVLEAIDKPQGLAVLGVLFSLSKDDNEALQPILDNLADVIDDQTEKPIQPVSIASLMPQDTSRYYRYNGSLTTPGCFESVVWTVFEQRLPISHKQMQMFRAILLPSEPDEDSPSPGDTPVVDNPSNPHTNGHSQTGGTEGGVQPVPGEVTSSGRQMVDNFRPVQPLHGRRVQRSFRFPGEKKKKSHWGYDGEAGPDEWAKLYPDKNCDGHHQSPININRKETKFDPNLRDVNIWYDPPLPGSKMVVKNNGHTVQVNLKGKYFITGAGLTKIYKTAQFHFHWGGPHSNKVGSEHTLDNQAYPLELHIVNYDSETYSSITEAMTQPLGLAVFGVFFKLSSDDNPALQSVIDVLDTIKDPNENREVEVKPISVKYFLPEDKTRYYRYNGSLTTPGCYESVIWTLFEQPQGISMKQLEKFWDMFQMDHSSHSGPTYNSGGNKRKSRQGEHGATPGVTVDQGAPRPGRKPHSKPRKRIRTNFRPVQPLNERSVYRSFEEFINYDDVRLASSRQCSGTNNVVSWFSTMALTMLTILIKTTLSHL